MNEIGHPGPTTFDRHIARTLREELSVYGDGAARVTREVEFNEGAGMYFTEAQPVRTGAAPLSLGFDGCMGGDTLAFAFGNTSFDFFPFTDETDLDCLRKLVRAVLAGRAEESGFKWAAHGRIFTEDGPVVVGHIGLPLPWRLRKALGVVRKYEPYGVRP